MSQCERVELAGACIVIQHRDYTVVYALKSFSELSYRLPNTLLLKTTTYEETAITDVSHDLFKAIKATFIAIHSK
jgi:hypothetical protein